MERPPHLRTTPELNFCLLDILLEHWVSSLLYISQTAITFRSLGTPTESSWPGVSSLQDYKPVFPRWEPQTITQVGDDANCEK